MALWKTAQEKLVRGRSTIDFLVRTKGAGAFEEMVIDSPVVNMWRADQLIMHRAVPFAFTTEVLVALGQAAVGIPLETLLVSENLPEQFSFWYFETPLQIQTTLSNEPLQSVSMGRLGTSFIISCWTSLPPPPEGHDSPTLYLSEIAPSIPSQVFTWELGESMEQMLSRCRAEHRKMYGAGGRYHKTEILGEEPFMAATENLARLILAAVAWLNQKVTVSEDKHLDRAEQRRMVRGGYKATPVKLVYLRRLEHQGTHWDADGNSTVREYSCRFVVDGHWRLQACGPQHQNRKLTYVHPYVKGPADKPLKAKPTAYVVNR